MPPNIVFRCYHGIVREVITSSVRNLNIGELTRTYSTRPRFQPLKHSPKSVTHLPFYQNLIVSFSYTHYSSFTMSMKVMHLSGLVLPDTQKFRQILNSPQSAVFLDNIHASGTMFLYICPIFRTIQASRVQYQQVYALVLGLPLPFVLSTKR